MVRAGTVTIESAGEQGQEVLTDVPRSDDVQQMINRLIEEDSGRRSRQAYGGYPQQQQQQGQYPQQPPYPPTQQYPPQA